MNQVKPFAGEPTTGGTTPSRSLFRQATDTDLPFGRHACEAGTVVRSCCYGGHFAAGRCADIASLPNVQSPRRRVHLITRAYERHHGPAAPKPGEAPPASPHRAHRRALSWKPPATPGTPTGWPTVHRTRASASLRAGVRGHPVAHEHKGATVDGRNRRLNGTLVTPAPAPVFWRGGLTRRRSFVNSG